MISTLQYFAYLPPLPPVPDSRTVSLLLRLFHLYMRAERKTEHVLRYLAVAELKEADVWLRDDIRIAWLTVLFCSQDVINPWETAFGSYLGKGSRKLIPLFVERARKHAAMESSPNSPKFAESLSAPPVLSTHPSVGSDSAIAAASGKNVAAFVPTHSTASPQVSLSRCENSGERRSDESNKADAGVLTCGPDVAQTLVSDRATQGSRPCQSARAVRAGLAPRNLKESA